MFGCGMGRFRGISPTGGRGQAVDHKRDHDDRQHSAVKGSLVGGIVHTKFQALLTRMRANTADAARHGRRIN
jgi:hypothetical protein